MSERGDKGLTLGECNLVVSKDSAFVRTVGRIDDLQSRLANTRVLLVDQENKDFKDIQTDLYEIMGSLYQRVEWKNGKERIKWLEEENVSKSERVENLGKFLIPGENEIESRVSLCRTGCRLVEEDVVSLKNERKKNKLYFDQNLIKYFNKLSTYFYLVWREKLD